MAILKCKMCGGDLNVSEGSFVAECEYCGTQQTVPQADNEKKVNLFNRANRLRMASEFDKAGTIYEQIIAEFPEEAEAYWGLCLCNYGIEYVDDPATANKIPTVHRASFDKLTQDENYTLACRYADMSAHILYQDQAEEIDRIMGEILSISRSEEPYDIFICYKETDENGRRTQDSVLANDLYHQLTQEGFKVFFSRITLEDKLGTAYEPYIFAALNSSKVMVVLGTKPEYFNAVWVKNEWSRYLAFIRNGAGKMLIPAYRDMDPYDLPEEFSHLQAQDMSKLGFMQDLIRGIKKIIGGDAPKETRETASVNSGGVNIAPLLKRAFMFLEDGNWQEADTYCERVLDQDPENAAAYLGKLMAEQHVRKQDDLKDCAQPFDSSDLYQKTLRFADPSLEKTLKEYISLINERNENARLTGIYNDAKNAMNAAYTVQAYKDAADKFASIPGFKDADDLVRQCLEKAEIRRKDAVYSSAKSEMIGEKAASYEKAIEIFKTIPGFKDADAQIIACQKKIEEIKAKEEADRIEAEKRRIEAERRAEERRLEEERKAEERRLEEERKAEERRIAAEKAAKKRKKIFAITTPIVAACIAFAIVLTTVIIPNSKYNAALSLLNDGKIVEAYDSLVALNGYKDSATKASEIFGQYKIEKVKIAEVGDIVYFGAYEQDNDTSNGKEDIEWIVLAKENGKALVISKYALDCQQYNSTYTDVTWETCSLRKWMNGIFLNNAFSAEEQAQIATTNVSADKNPVCSTNPDNTTTDKVFLLSIAEAEKYFTTGESRKCVPTAYAEAQGAQTSDSYKTAGGEATCRWWLRSPGSYQNYAARVYPDGSVDYYGNFVDHGHVCVRPALWINLE